MFRHSRRLMNVAVGGDNRASKRHKDAAGSGTNVTRRLHNARQQIITITTIDETIARLSLIPLIMLLMHNFLTCRRPLAGVYRKWGCFQGRD